LPDKSGVVVCPNPECHREIEEPILLNCLSTASKEKYYACPYCFMKLDVNAENPQPQKKEKSQEQKEPSVKPPKKEAKELSQCPHDFGYLAKRPKNSPIPQECLVCSKTVECILQPYQKEESRADK